MGLSLLRRKQMGLWVQQMLSSLPLKIFLKKSFFKGNFWIFMGSIYGFLSTMAWSEEDVDNWQFFILPQ